MTFWIGNIMFY